MRTLIKEPGGSNFQTTVAEKVLLQFQIVSVSLHGGSGDGDQRRIECWFEPFMHANLCETDQHKVMNLTTEKYLTCVNCCATAVRGVVARK